MHLEQMLGMGTDLSRALAACATLARLVLKNAPSTMARSSASVMKHSFSSGRGSGPAEIEVEQAVIAFDAKRPHDVPQLVAESRAAFLVDPHDR